MAADPSLQIPGLSVQHLIHLSLDGKAARKDWTTIAALAQTIGDGKRGNRARGQLGLVAGADGGHATALISLVSAIQKARMLGDLTAEIYFRTFLGNRLAPKLEFSHGGERMRACRPRQGSAPARMEDASRCDGSGFMKGEAT